MGNSSIRYLLTAWLICCILTGCERKQQYYVSAGANHTYYKITYQFTEPIDAEIGEAFRSYYHSINPFDSLSIISAVNNNKNMTVDSIFINAFLIAEDISEQTGGAFDITCAPLLNLWGFGFSKMDSVTPQLVDSLRAFVGYDKVSLQGNTIIKKTLV